MTTVASTLFFRSECKGAVSTPMNALKAAVVFTVVTILMIKVIFSWNESTLLRMWLMLLNYHFQLHDSKAAEIRLKRHREEQ